MGFFDDVWDAAEDAAHAAAAAAEAAAEALAAAAEAAAEALAAAAEAAAEAAAAAAEAAAEALAEAAEAAAAEAQKVAEAAFETAKDAAAFGVDVATSGIDIAGRGVELAQDQIGTAFERVTEPVLGHETARELGELAGDAALIGVTGGMTAAGALATAAGVKAGGETVEDLSGDLGVDQDTSRFLGDAAKVGLGMGAGMSTIEAAENAGMDPGEVAGDLTSSATDWALGQDGGAAAGRFADAAVSAYGDEVSSQQQRGGMDAYDDPSYDLTNPVVDATPHDIEYDATPAERQEFESAAKEFSSEYTEAFYEPIIGQEAAEKLGQAAPDIAIETVQLIASGGTSAAQVAVKAGDKALEAATGKTFEDHLGETVEDFLEPAVGREAAGFLGDAAAKGAGAGIDWASGGADLDDLDPANLDEDDLLDAGKDLFGKGVKEVTGIDPAQVERVLDGLDDGDLGADDAKAGLDLLGEIAPKELDPFLKVAGDVATGDTAAIPAHAGELAPQGVRDLVELGTSVADDPDPLGHLPGLGDLPSSLDDLDQFVEHDFAPALGHELIDTAPHALEPLLPPADADDDAPMTPADHHQAAVLDAGWWD